MPAGRPTEYSENILSKSREYVDSCVDELEDRPKTVGTKSTSYERVIKVNLPTIEGLASHLGLARSTLYEWKDKYTEFSDILEILLAHQATALINNGLSGDYNATIAKLLLMKHGYKEDARIYERITGNEIIFKDMSVVGVSESD
ncbi:MAG TPA: terminase small subunit [Candidatus Paceibacterota bacterium]